ncbi:MAG TPA: MmoB/DmpM family protein [Kofleriaceae bacterium]|nr:MmoB/DmpM family protein [Kofleriaceae bacterium]
MNVARSTVGISLMMSPETEATVEYVRAQMPSAIIDFRDVFYKIEREGYLEFQMSEIAEYLGRELDTNLFLVSMSSYYGRIVVSDDKVEIFSAIVPPRFQD